MDYYFSGQRVPTEGLVEQCRRCVWYAVGISRKKIQVNLSWRVMLADGRRNGIGILVYT